MSCSPSDLKDYLFGELPAQNTATLEAHIAGCVTCREELDRLRVTHSALAALGDQELPRRIAFVSDKVFEPGWWQRFWQSGPRLGFASAAVLAIAILAHAVTRPAPVLAPTSDAAIVEARVEAEIARRLPAAVAQAVVQLEQRQGERLLQVVSASEKKLSFERRADLATVAENFRVLSNQLNRIEKQSYAAADFGASR